MSREAESRTGMPVCLMLAALLLSSCAGLELPEQEPVRQTAVPPAPETPPPPPAPPQPVYRETGIASWYGREFQGRRTTSGEVFDMDGLSAAHRTLPLGTVISVTNLDNFRSITVRVNDRGPFAGNRVLELSYGAARELGFASQGTARVRIEVMDRIPDKGPFTVHAAFFSEEESAHVLKERLNRRFEVVVITPFQTNAGTFYRVRVGSYQTEQKAEAIAAKLKLEGLEPFVMRKD